MAWNDRRPTPVPVALEGVNLVRAGRAVLWDVSLNIAPGEFHALAGSKNSGKSAICRVLTGDLRPDSGLIRIGGSAYPGLSRGQAEHFSITSVGGEAMVFPHLSVVENLLSGEAFWRKALRPWRSFVRDMDAWLTSLGIDLPLNQTLEHLPGADWVFVEILGRLHHSPNLLILDEALESLTAARRRQLMPLLKRYMAAGMSVLWVTHKVEDALLVVDRLTVVRNGEVLITTPPGGIDQLSLIQLCYSQIEDLEPADSASRQFQQLMRFTDALIRDLPQAVALLDDKRRVAFINRRARALFTDGGGAWLDQGLGHLLGARNAQLTATVLAGMDAGRDMEWHNLPVRNDAGDMLADVTLRRIMEAGLCAGHMILIEDVSAREELRGRMVLSDNLASVGLLAAGVAHEVNNPLEVMGNYLTYLKGQTDNEEFRRILAKLEEEGARIQQIVNNLIVFSGGVSVASSRVDLRDLCDELCELLRFHNRDKRIAIVVNPPRGKPLVRADRNEMRQVLLNLFRNSIEALREGGRIQVDFAASGPAAAPLVVMTISDNGPGISLANPADIFLPFVTTRKSSGKNHGLGLFIVYGIVEKYEGTIQVENLPAGGCRFTITLPGAGDAGEAVGKSSCADFSH